MTRALLLFFLCIALGSFNPDSTGNETGKKYNSDFKILVASLQELQPCLYRNISKEEFDRQVQLTSDRLLNTSLRNKAIYIIQEFFYKLGNSHAGNVSVYGDIGTQKALPMNFYIVDHELYIKDFPADSSFNGTKVLTIGNTKAGDLIDSLKIFFLRDGIRETMDPNLQCYFNNLYGAFCAQPDTFHIDTEKGKIVAPALLRGTPLFKQVVLSNGKSYFGTDEERILTRKVEKEYGYFRFINFRKKIRKIKIEDEYISFIKEMNQKQIPDIIIDLRDNNGGEGHLSAEMASWLSDHDILAFTNSYITTTRKPAHIDLMDDKSYFRKRLLFSRKEDSLRRIYSFIEGKTIAPKKHRYKGHVYILVSPFTQSASSMFCGFLNDQENVTFVGDETNGAINYFWAGNYFSAMLPNLKTNFSFGVELLEMKQNSCRTEMMTPLIPDVKIKYTIADRMAKRDLEMEWVKADIARKK